MLARLQQVLTLTLLALAIAWLAVWWPHSAAIAIAGFVAPALGYAGILALEFLLLRSVGRSQTLAPPPWADLARAWLGEVLQGPRVFCWRQPFRSEKVADYLPVPGTVPPMRGVVLIHGFVCNRGFWTPWLERLRHAGHPFVAVNLEPVFGSLDDYVPIVEDAVRRVTAASGLPPDMVCHSMGGLAVRGWLRTMHADGRVRRVITIGTPHRGTWLSRLSSFRNGRQMHPSSTWLAELADYANETRHAAFMCWYSDCDNIVFPAETATLAGADNRLVRGVAHVDLAFHPQVIAESLAAIAAG